MLQKIIAFVVSMMLAVPFIAFAEDTAPSSSRVDSTAAATEIVLSTMNSATTSASLAIPAAIQNTAEAQDVVTTASLEETADPTDILTGEIQTISIEGSTTTPEIVDAPLENGSEPIQEVIAVVAHEELVVVAETLAPTVETVATENIPLNKLNTMLEPEYVIALSGKTIATKIAPGAEKSLTTRINATDGALTLTGSCAEKFYVVLVYRSQVEYETDPSSYIVNRAYPCETGTFDYTIDDLPTSLESGTYYLLVGEQGNRGMWRPVTPLTEVTINRNN